MALAISLQDLFLSWLMAQHTNVTHGMELRALPHMCRQLAGTPQELCGCWSPQHIPHSHGLHGQNGLSPPLTAESLRMFSQV